MDFSEYDLLTFYLKVIFRHLYFSLIFTCGLSKMNISNSKLCTHCSTSKTFVQFSKSHPFLDISWKMMGNFCWPVREQCLASAGCTLWDWIGGWWSGAGRWRLPPGTLTLSPLLSLSPWVGCALPPFLPFCCEFLSAKCFLGCVFWVLSFSLPFLHFPQWRWCGSLAVAVEIAEHLSVPLFLCPSAKALQLLHGLAGCRSCLSPHINFSCSQPWADSRLVRCVPLSWDGQLCYFILLQAYSKSHWSEHNSGGHWISIYFCLWAAEDPAQIRAVRGPVPVNDGVLWILACLGWQTGEMQLDKERVRKFTALSPSISLLLCSYHNIGPLITGDTKDERELLLAMCCIRQKI